MAMGVAVTFALLFFFYRRSIRASAADFPLSLLSLEDSELSFSCSISMRAIRVVTSGIMSIGCLGWILVAADMSQHSCCDGSGQCVHGYVEFRLAPAGRVTGGR